MQSFVIPGNSNKPISLDIQFPEPQGKYPLIIFLHGFKGFKDWGQWPLMAAEFTKRGFAVLRMNFSHNGTTPDNLLDFVDLEAFGNNTFSKEVQDVKDVIDWVFVNKLIQEKLDLNQLFVVAHSRGGAIAMISAAEDSRVKKIATLSAVSTLQRYSEEELSYWKENGVVYMLNGRTNQNMPLYYSLAQDYLSNISRLELSQVVPKIEQAYLVIHAEEDETVPLIEAQKIASWGKKTTLKVLTKANHSFGGAHPFSSSKLPTDTQKAVELMSHFFTGNE